MKAAFCQTNPSATGQGRVHDRVDAAPVIHKAGCRPEFHKLNKLTIKVDRPQLSPADIKKLEEGMKQAADAK